MVVMKDIKALFFVLLKRLCGRFFDGAIRWRKSIAKRLVKNAYECKSHQSIQTSIAIV